MISMWYNSGSDELYVRLKVRDDIPVDAQIIYDLTFTSDINDNYPYVVERAVVFTNKCVEPTSVTLAALSTLEIEASSTDTTQIDFPTITWSPAEFSQSLCGKMSVIITETTSGTTFESQLGTLPSVDSSSDPTKINIPAPSSSITGGHYTFDVTIEDTINGVTDTV